MTTFPKPTPRPAKPRAQLTRTPLKRGKPLRAKRWGIKYKRPRRLDRGGADPLRLAFVAGLECVGLKAFPGIVCADGATERHCCVEGRVEVCHEGRTGKGMATRCPDSETIPMCTGLHRQWTEHRGWFAGWTKDERREWASDRIAETTSLFLGHGGRRGTR